MNKQQKYAKLMCGIAIKQKSWLTRKGWVESSKAETWSHPELAPKKKLDLIGAVKMQKAYTEKQKAEHLASIPDFLIKGGWEKVSDDLWRKPHWEEKRKGICCATMKQAYKIQVRM